MREMTARGRRRGITPKLRWSEGGITLIEMLVVIVILSMLLGMSVVLFRNSNRDLGVRAAANQVVAVLRGAEEHARASRSPAWVVLNLEESSLYALTEEIVQTWNLEDDRGAFDMRATLQGVRPVPGREGMAYQFAAQSVILCPPVPVHLPEQGIGLELWMYRIGTRGSQVLCKIGSQLELSCDGAGRLTARVGACTMTLPQMAFVPAERWTHVKVVHNGAEGRLYVNGAEADVKQGAAPWSKEEALVIGDRKDSFVGIIDSVRVSLILPRDKYWLPRDVTLALPEGVRAVRGEFVIAFTPQGRLDPTRHPAPVTFTVKSPADEKTVTVSTLGGVLR